MTFFFDLNIPYNEHPSSPSPENTTKRNTRLKTTVQAMELGYIAIAYNHSIKGFISDSNKCPISLFPLPSLSKSVPYLFNSINFHRNLLSVPLTSPFLQYTRLTVSVDSVLQLEGLNSKNGVIKSYDLLAVRPLNQNTFDKACEKTEVDLIAIDFSENLPFRLKLPMIKLALGRGIYFEITYSRFISDKQARKQMITNAKLLVDWTRGKNIIFSSAAASVIELRGPHDAANLSCLLGLSMEQAKATISKNCRSLLASALRRKQFYKETIKVERIFSAQPMDSKEPLLVRHCGDTKSSGEGDLPLDDIAKLFSACSEVSKTSKAINFASVVEDMPSKDMRLKGLLAAPNDTSSSLSVATEFVGFTKTKRELKECNRFRVVSAEDEIPLATLPLKLQKIGSQDLDSGSQEDIPAVFTNTKDSNTSVTCCEELKTSDGGVPVAVGLTSHDTPTQISFSACDAKPLFPDDNFTFLPSFENSETSPCNVEPKGSIFLEEVSTSRDHGCRLVSTMDTSEHRVPSHEVDVDPKGSIAFGVVSSLKDHASTTGTCLVFPIDTSKPSLTSKEVNVDPKGSTVVSSFYDHVSTSGTGLVTPMDTSEHCMISKAVGLDPKGCSGLDVVSSPKDHVSTIGGTSLVSPMDDSEHYTPSKEFDRSSYWNEDSTCSVQDARVKEFFSKTNKAEQTELALVRCDMLIHKEFSRNGQHGQCSDDSYPLVEDKLLESSYEEMQETTLVADKVLPKKVSDELQNQQLEGEGDTKIFRRSPYKSKSGKVRFKQTASRKALPFPFKRLYLSRKNTRNC